MAKTNIVAEPGKQEIVITRVFDAPRDLVFRISTDPSLIPQWWGPRKYETIVDKMDVRPGGEWRFINRDDKGNEYTFHGFYHEIVAPERTVQTFEYEGAPGHISLETCQMVDQDGKTLMINTAVYQSVEDRDAMIQSGMAEGAEDLFDRLAELVESAKTAAV
jgi:uncharacterized protein YndB with AHSA1/START domain